MTCITQLLTPGFAKLQASKVLARLSNVAASAALWTGHSASPAYASVIGTFDSAIPTVSSLMCWLRPANPISDLLRYACPTLFPSVAQADTAAKNLLTTAGSENVSGFPELQRLLHLLHSVAHDMQLCSPGTVPAPTLVYRVFLSVVLPPLIARVAFGKFSVLDKSTAAPATWTGRDAGAQKS